MLLLLAKTAELLNLFLLTDIREIKFKYLKFINEYI